ncbi:MAG: peptidoglycan editing factor PgeF [Halioglobus sp.]|nr:peptidoglycan editing factor PgeF [Halioglobus sp.]
MTQRFIEADWPAPANVLALSTTRLGGRSEAPFDSFNLGCHVGDNGDAVAENRRILAAALPGGAALSWLSQVHGTAVVEAGGRAVAPLADAQWSRTPGAVCTVMTADCLPVLFCSTDGDVVAAAHAGWRGLQAGVLDTTVASMQTPPEQLLAWLGPAIGPGAFEVGEEVRDAFLSVAAPAQATAVADCFASVASRPGHYLADLYALARIRLQALGVTRVFGGGWCTHSDSTRFFSYRRDGDTGRMASLILLR